jgi:hypothetical protein
VQYITQQFVKMVSESEAQQIYKSVVHFDGLNIANWSRDIFEAWNRGGITGVSCTCGLWEGFRQSIANVVQWKKWFEEHSDLIVQAHSGRYPESEIGWEDGCLTLMAEYRWH